MSTQFIRACSLAVGPAAGGQGLDLSNLRIRFRVTRADTQSPHHAEIRVYNLSDDTAKQLKALQEYGQVVLQAGYPENMAQIFTGQIRQVRRGRETPVLSFVDIIAADGDQAYGFAVMNTSLAAGSTKQQQLNSMLASAGGYGVVAGYTPPLAGGPLPRGKAMFGMTRDYLRDFGATQQASWFVENGALNMVPVKATLPYPAIVLTAQTGMIGLPTQTIDGIQVRCLLNPQIRIGGQVQIDNKSIQEAMVSVDYTAINYFPSLDADGYYKVLSVNHVGDTRGQEWYSELICQGVDGSASLSKNVLGIVPPPGP
ncbi:MAG: hypothetical protein KGH75_02475 [Rhodospirillales bacterium]|nr:hypothetical protein [Rhodospirillales bacterium]